ncbi:MAG: HlyC/CorC family transporter [Gammaproteobacteria bacterium]
MNDFPLLSMVIALVALIGASAYFSGSETAMMALNRYRLRHLAEREHRGAQRAQRLLDRPDRLIGLILLGNNFVNILAAQIFALLTLELVGEGGLIASTLVLTAVVLIFAEVMPKTLAALHPERVAFPSSWLLGVLMFVLYPLVWLLNQVTNGLLGLFGLSSVGRAEDPLSREELRTVVKEAGAMIPQKHRQMLFGILDLENVTVEDIMVPRADIDGINLEDEWADILEQLVTCHHTRMPCYSGSIDNVEGVLHMRRVTRLLRSDEFDIADLRAILHDPYYVPLTTDLYVQLLNFQKARQRIAFVVDEYGDICGLVTLEDLLEEVIGEFTTDPQIYVRDVYPQDDGSFLVDGSANIREINRAYGFGLPADGPKTINGLILETLEDIPITGTTFRIGDMTIEIVQTLERSVKTARLTMSGGAAAGADGAAAEWAGS